MEAVKKKNRLGHRDRSWKIFLAVMAVIALIPLVYALSLSVRTQNSILQQLQCFAHPWQSMDFPERMYTEKLLCIT